MKGSAMLAEADGVTASTAPATAVALGAPGMSGSRSATASSTENRRTKSVTREVEDDRGAKRLRSRYGATPQVGSSSGR